MSADPIPSNSPRLLDNVGRLLDENRARWAAIGVKLYAGGPKDLEDAEGVLRVQAGRLDLDLIRNLCKGFGARAVKACERLLAKTG